MQSVRVVIVPGNGCGDVRRSNWYGWLCEKLTKQPGVVPVLQNMPGAWWRWAGPLHGVE
jgi:hypothetical protein